MQFTDREKQLQQILKSDKRFLEFLKDKDVNRKKLVDEKGRKMDIKGFVDLKRWSFALNPYDLIAPIVCQFQHWILLLSINNL